MFKKCIFVISILLAIAFISVPIGLSTNTVLAHGHGHKQHGCRDCGHYVCRGDCGECEECLAREKVSKCKKCGHVDCPGNCNKCPDCLNERIEKLEKELQKEKD